MVVGEGFEPSKAVPADLQSAPFGHSGTPPRGIAYSLAFARKDVSGDSFSKQMVVGEGFEPSKAVPADLQSAPFGHSGTPPRGIAHCLAFAGKDVSDNSFSK